MWCLRGYYFKMAPGTVKKAIAQGNDLNKKYSDVKANKVLQYVDDLVLKVSPSKFWILKLKFLF